MICADNEICPISGESAREERLNYITHLIGLVFSLIGCAILLLRVASRGDEAYFMGCAVYALTLVLLYAASTYYHSCRDLTRKRLLKIGDHICIYLLIAGSYTPYTIGPLQAHGGLELLYVIWMIAIAGSLFKIVATGRFVLISTIGYMAMGWLILFILPALMRELSLSSLAWLFAGGAAYSVGAIFYLWENLPYNHAIWHLFVLGGSGCHFLSILYL